MTTFLYKAKNREGRMVAGTIEAKNDQEATQILWENKLKVIDLIPKSQNESFFSSLFNRVSVTEKAIFARQLATMVSVGIHLTTALNVTLAQTRNARLKSILKQVIQDIESGYSLSTALAKHPDVFDKVFTSAIKAGEAAGKVDTILLSLADRIEKDASFKSKVRASLIYPAFVFVILIIIAIVMMVKVIPQIKTILEESGGQLPLATRALLFLSDILSSYWWLLLILLLIFGVGLQFYLKTPSGKRQWGNLMVKIPLFGNLNRYAVLTRFAYNFGLLVKTGIPILDALYSVAEIMDNDVYRKSLYKVAQEVERGVSISVPLSKDPLYPPIVSQMVAVGEQSGTLDKILERLGEYYQNIVDEQTKTLASLIEPVVIVMIGGGVGVLVFAVLLPIYSIAQNVQ